MEDGGETAFPQGTWLNDTLQRQGRYSECAARGIAVRPRKGDAILFWSLQPDGGRERAGAGGLGSAVQGGAEQGGQSVEEERPAALCC